MKTDKGVRYGIFPVYDRIGVPADSLRAAAAPADRPRTASLPADGPVDRGIRAALAAGQYPHAVQYSGAVFRCPTDSRTPRWRDTADRSAALCRPGTRAACTPRCRARFAGRTCSIPLLFGAVAVDLALRRGADGGQPPTSASAGNAPLPRKNTRHGSRAVHAPFCACVPQPCSRRTVYGRALPPADHSAGNAAPGGSSRRARPRMCAHPRAGHSEKTSLRCGALRQLV